MLRNNRYIWELISGYHNFLKDKVRYNRIGEFSNTIFVMCMYRTGIGNGNYIIT